MIALFLIGIIPCAILIYILLIRTSHQKSNALRGGAADIDVIISIYFLIYYLQVIVACLFNGLESTRSNWSFLGQTRIRVDQEQFYIMAGLWILAFVSFVFWRLVFSRIFTGKDPFDFITYSSLYYRKRLGSIGAATSFLIIFAVAIFEISVVARFGFSGLLDFAAARLSKSEDSYLLLISLLLVTPAVISTFSFQMKTKSFIILWTMALIVAGLGGGRGSTFVLIFIFVLRLILIDFRKIGLGWLIAGLIPAIFGIYVYTNIMRFRGDESSRHGGILEFLVNSETFGSWKSLTAIIQGGFTLPIPGYSLSAAVFYPFPRALIPFKPYPPSSLFTMEVSPNRFANTNSEITMSGLGDMIANFGILFGPLSFGLILALVSSYACRIRSSGAGLGTAIYVSLILFCMTFFRADAFGASRVVWFTLLIIIFSRFLSRLFVKNRN